MGMSTTVINMHTVKPLDTVVLDDICEHSNLVVTVEEHSVIGGLGSAVAEYLSQKQGAPPQAIIGIPDHYGQGGEYSDLLELYGLKSNAIAETIKDLYKS
jgi:transketolase